MSPFFRSRLVALFSSAAFLVACDGSNYSDTNINIQVTHKTTGSSPYTSTVVRKNDDVSVKIEPSNQPQQAEHFAFKCSDGAGLEAAHQRAAAEIKDLDILANKHLKTMTPDILSNPDELKNTYRDLNNRNYAHGKRDALQEAMRICNLTYAEFSRD